MMNDTKRVNRKPISRGQTLIVVLGLLTVIGMTAAATHSRSQTSRVMVGSLRVQKALESRANAAVTECLSRIMGSRDLQNAALALCTPNSVGDPAGLPSDAEMGTTAAASIDATNTDANCIGSGSRFVLFPLRTGPTNLTPDMGGERLSQCILFRRRTGASRYFVLRAYGLFGSESSTYASLRSQIEVTFDGDFQTITEQDIKTPGGDNDSFF